MLKLMICGDNGEISLCEVTLVTKNENIKVVISIMHPYLWKRLWLQGIGTLNRGQLWRFPSYSLAS